jgi:hypothetical protein
MDISDKVHLFEAYIITKYGTVNKSKIVMEDVDPNSEPLFSWRVNEQQTNPNPVHQELNRLCCKFSFVKYIRDPQPSPLLMNYQRILIYINSFELVIDLSNEMVNNFYYLFKEFHKKSIKIQTLERGLKSYMKFSFFHAFQTEAATKEEQLRQLHSHLKLKEAALKLHDFIQRYQSKALTKSVSKWVEVVTKMNEGRMITDRHRWRLHATSNLDIDLQAWYHALFFQEVYRLRGKFFFKEAILPVYRQSYDLVDNALTPYEEAALAHVLCSPDTSYGDVAGQMFIVQAILPVTQYELFQKLASQGVNVTKYPRQGRPAKKLFRFSFVEGNIYLTWKGKFGNQGVGMFEVTSVVQGIQTDVLKWSASSKQAHQFLSVICADRSVDLFFESIQERNYWYDVLQALVQKEQGKLLNNIPGIEVGLPTENLPFEQLILYGSIGKKFAT